MICGNCRHAGTFTTCANRTPDPAEAEVMRANARAWHARCKPGWCDCQHSTDDLINRKRLNNAVHQ